MVLVTYKPMNSIVLVGLIIIAIHFLQSGRKHVTLPGAEESMTTTIEFITALFCQVDDQLAGLPKHPEAHLWPSEIVTLGRVELSRRVTPLDWSPQHSLPVSSHTAPQWYLSS